MCDVSQKIMRNRLARAKTPTAIYEASLESDHAMETHEMTIMKINAVFDEALNSAKIFKNTCYSEPLVRKPWYESYVKLTPFEMKHCYHPMIKAFLQKCISFAKKSDWCAVMPPLKTFMPLCKAGLPIGAFAQAINTQCK